jgi:protein gp37
MGTKGYGNGFELTLLPERLSEPILRKKPTIFFVNSMSDLFHEKVPFSYIDQVFDIICRSPQHTFQILTERATRMAEYFDGKIASRNAWLGVTVENREHGLPRIDALRKLEAPIRFLSVEPLLESLGAIDLTGIHWVIVGGESGPKARPMKKEWIDHIRVQCEEQGVSFFFKQWGGWGADGIKRAKKQNGRELDGQVWNQVPLKAFGSQYQSTQGGMWQKHITTGR